MEQVQIYPHGERLSRQIQAPFYLRDVISTAYVSLSNGTETTLLAGIPSTFLDMVQITATNSSSVAVQVDIRDATGGGIVSTIEIPPTDTKQIVLNVPLRQNEAANTWTADLPDITATTVTLAATFIQNA